MNTNKQLIQLIDDAINELNTPTHTHTLESASTVYDTPDFEINDKLGEGEATGDEKDYRTELLLLLASIFPLITTIVKSSKDVETKLNKIDDILGNYKADTNDLINEYTNNIHKTAVKTANNKLKTVVSSDLKMIAPPTEQLALIQSQQIRNSEDIANFIRGRMAQGLSINDVNRNYVKTPEQLEKEYQFINSAFNQAQSRLDGMGMYGYLETNKSGLMDTYIQAQDLLEGRLYADWNRDPASTFDCAECDELEANSPYPVDDWPADPHDGCRCSQGDPFMQHGVMVNL